MILALAVSCTPLPPVAEPIPGSGWALAPPLLAPLQEHAVVALDGQVVVLGGYDDRVAMVDRVEAFDPVTARWRSLAPLPRPAHHLNAAAIDGSVYVVGALGASFLELDVAWRYDPEEDAWSSLTPAPFDRRVGASAVAVMDGQIHVIGGLQAGRTVALHSVYDPVGDRWTALPDAPRARDHAAATALGDTLWVASGRDGGLTALVSETDRYTATGWSTASPQPTPRGGIAAALGGDGRWHVLGGEGNNSDPYGVFGDHERFDPEVDRWDRLGPMPNPRHGMGATFVDGSLWVPGGARVDGFGATDLFEVWTP